MQRKIWNGSVLTGCGTRQRCRCSPFAAALFKSAVLPVPLKRNCRIKQKRQLSKAVFFVVRVVIQNFSKTIVVQFVFEAIG